MPAKMRHFSIKRRRCAARQTLLRKACSAGNSSPGSAGLSIWSTSAISGVGGGLQGRREIVPGAKMLGFEVTMAVEDIDATVAAVEAAGGKIVMPPYTALKASAN